MMLNSDMAMVYLQNNALAECKAKLGALKGKAKHDAGLLCTNKFGGIKSSVLPGIKA